MTNVFVAFEPLVVFSYSSQGVDSRLICNAELPLASLGPEGI